MELRRAQERPRGAKTVTRSHMPRACFQACNAQTEALRCIHSTPCQCRPSVPAHIPLESWRRVRLELFAAHWDCALPPAHLAMDTAEALSAAANGSTTALSNATSAINASVAALEAAETASPSTFGLLARVILTVLKVLPGTLYWIITFTTITLPTWLFTLFSMSLTFTMNFTTLCVLPV